MVKKLKEDSKSEKKNFESMWRNLKTGIDEIQMRKYLEKLNTNFQEIDHEAPMKEYLKKINISTLQEKIREFRRVNFQEISSEDLREKIYNTLINEDRKVVFPTNVRKIEKGEIFYRARRTKDTDIKLALESMSEISDAWNPPSECVKEKGRLNKIEESLLYVSLDNHSIPVREVKVEQNKLYFLIIYESIKNMKINFIVQKFEYLKDKFTDEEMLKIDIIIDFLNTEFAKKVEKETEFLYKISEFITKEFHDLPQEVQDAWGYHSIAEKNGVNICMRPDKAKEKLELKAVILCENINLEDISPKKILIPSILEKGFEMFDVSDEIMSKILSSYEKYKTELDGSIHYRKKGTIIS